MFQPTSALLMISYTIIFGVHNMHEESMYIDKRVAVPNQMFHWFVRQRLPRNRH